MTSRNAGNINIRLSPIFPSKLLLSLFMNHIVKVHVTRQYTQGWNFHNSSVSSLSNVKIIIVCLCFVSIYKGTKYSLNIYNIFFSLYLSLYSMTKLWLGFDYYWHAMRVVVKVNKQHFLSNAFHHRPYIRIMICLCD